MTYNLLRENWIPARAADGSTRWVAPADIPRLGADLVDIEWGRPEFRVATHEWLVGVFAVALADRLLDSGDWAELFEAPPDDLAARLARLEPWFDLDGEGPRFLQDLAPLAGAARPVEALLIDAAGENTLKNGADLFAKRGRFAVLSRKAAAVALHAMQAFAPSGGAGHRTSMRGGGPLTTLVVPERPTLWRRIVANLPLLDEAEKELAATTDLGVVFPWAKPTRVSTDGRKTGRGEDAHYLQCFFGMPRRIRLVFAANEGGRACAVTGEVDETVVTGFVTEPWGVSYGVWRHPLSPYYLARPGEPPLPIHAQGGRIGYRDWAAYLFRAGDSGDLRAEQVADFARCFPRQRHARLFAAGFVTDNMKCLDWAEGEAPLWLLPNPAAQARLARLAHERFTPTAGTVAFALRSALREALGADDAQKTAVAAAHERFWIETNDPFFHAIETAEARLRALGPEVDADAANELDLADASQALLRALSRSALRIFEETAPIDRLGDLDEKTVARIVAAAKALRLALLGYGKLGADLFDRLGLPAPARATASATIGGARP